MRNSYNVTALHKPTSDEKRLITQLNTINHAMRIIYHSSYQLNSQLLKLSNPASFFRTMARNVAIEVLDTTIRTTMIIAAGLIGLLIGGPLGSVVAVGLSVVASSGIRLLLDQCKQLSHKSLYPTSTGHFIEDVWQQAHLQELSWLRCQYKIYANEKLITEAAIDISADNLFRKMIGKVVDEVVIASVPVSPVGGVSLSEITRKGHDGRKAFANLRNEPNGIAGGGLGRDKIRKLRESYGQYGSLLSTLQQAFSSTLKKLEDSYRAHTSSDIEYHLLTKDAPKIDQPAYEQTLSMVTAVAQKLEALQNHQEMPPIPKGEQIVCRSLTPLDSW